MKTLKAFSEKSTKLVTVLLLFISAGAFAQAAKVIEMKGTDQLRFSVESIEATPGQKITVKLTNDSKFPAAAMSHNFVLLKQSSDAKAVDEASVTHRENEYIAPEMKDKIIAHTGLASGGQTVQVTFNAPKKPGKYLYICTFPGHFNAGMKGTLTVK